MMRSMLHTLGSVNPVKRITLMTGLGRRNADCVVKGLRKSKAVICALVKG